MKKRLALGTVQFGIPYGVANQDGQVSHDEASAILTEAWNEGVGTLDTAIAYGESEKRLGEVGIEQWQVISKLPATPIDDVDVAQWVHYSVEHSLKRLGVSKLRGLLLHDSQQLLGPKGGELYQSLMMLKDQNKVEKIGVSIYSPDELDELWPDYQIDIIQAPFNILDRRLATTGWLARLHQAGTEVHIRSVFLQGLLLMDSDKRPGKFNRWESLWEQWRKWLGEQGLSSLQACLGFVLAQSEIDRVVVGVDSLKHMQEILANAEELSMELPEALATEDLDLITPSRWSLL